MAAGDLIQVRKIITEAGLTSTNGIAEPVTLADFALLQPAASATQAGPVRQMTFTAQLTAAPTQADFNGLLTKLITAGLMAAS